MTEYIHSLLGKSDRLVPMFIYTISGFFFTLGVRALLNNWIQGGKKEIQLLQDYVEAIEGIKHTQHVFQQPRKLNFLAEVADGKYRAKRHHLVWFFACDLDWVHTVV